MAYVRRTAPLQAYMHCALAVCQSHFPLQYRVKRTSSRQVEQLLTKSSLSPDDLYLELSLVGLGMDRILNLLDI